jgi:hypothetical protein
MRFTTVEVSRAYSDYLDSLDDWPPPEERLTTERYQATQYTPDTEETPPPPQRGPN